MENEAKKLLIEKITEKFDCYSDLAEHFNIDLFELVENEVQRQLENKTILQLIGEL